MTVYYELDRSMQLPMVPIILNCTTPPLMTLQQSYDFGVALGDAIRSYTGLERVALVGGGGLSHFVGEPRVGDIDEEFDRWFLDQLESGDLKELLRHAATRSSPRPATARARCGPGWRSPAPLRRAV